MVCYDSTEAYCKIQATPNKAGSCIAHKLVCAVNNVQNAHIRKAITFVRIMKSRAAGNKRKTHCYIVHMMLMTQATKRRHIHKEWRHVPLLRE